MSEYSKINAWNAQQSVCALAEAQYDQDLDEAGADREAIKAATQRYETALAAARKAYNDVLWPGVF